MKFQDDISNMNTYTHTHIRTSRNQYVPHFFKVGGIKIIRNAIVDHMTSNNLFSKAQHGFIAGRSCVTQLLEFMEDITEVIDSGKEVDVIYLDFCKAFDEVPHKRLLTKMHKYGIKGNILNWVKAFLSEGQQRVIVNGSASGWEDITSGIPQGSVLGPILFLIYMYINDLPGAVAGLIKLFADDTKAYSTVESNQKELALQSHVTRSETWAAVWQMFFNILECHHLHIGNLETDFKYEMTTNECKIAIEQVKSERDLGVIVDRKLKFREHINNNFKYEMTTNECKIAIEQVKLERDLGVIVDSCNGTLPKRI